MKDIKENARITLVNRQSAGSESEKIEFISVSHVDTVISTALDIEKLPSKKETEESK